MSRTSNTFSMLQAIAAVASIAIIMWSLGLPVMQFAQAANVTQISNTLSSSEPSTVADHTIYFETPTGVLNGQTITVDFSDGPFGVAGVDFSDIDVQDGDTDLTLAADCTGADQASAAFAATTLTITFCPGDGASLAPGASTTIEIGQNATGGVANAQMVNPAVQVDSYEIPVTAGVDLGETRVVILDQVTVSATVDTIFTFTVTGVGAGVLVNTGDTTGGLTTATTIPFGQLEAGTASTAAQALEVSTNAANGFVVTVAADHQLLSSNGADIDSFTDGTDVAVPEAWASPSESIGVEAEYGHWGLSTTDDSLLSAADFSNGDDFAAVLTTPTEVFYHSGPSDGSVDDEGTATVIYKVEVSELQEAADDYTATLTYVATPVF